MASPASDLRTAQIRTQWLAGSPLFAACLALAAVFLLWAAATGDAVGKSDLMVMSIKTPPARATAGGKFRTSAQIHNQGRSRVAVSKTGWYLSTDKALGRDVRVGRANTPALKANKLIRVSVRLALPSRLAAKRYYLFVCADDLKKVSESNERNNCVRAVRRIRVAAAAVIDKTAPAAPSLLATSPVVAGSDSTPTLTGRAEAGSLVRIFNTATAPACQPVSASIAQTTTLANGNWSVSMPELAPGIATTYVATATDVAANASTCSEASLNYTYDPSGPAAPSLTGTTPASPNASGSVTLLGTGGASLTLHLFVNGACTGTPTRISEVTAMGTISEDFTVGIGTTTFSARVEAGGVGSPCSNAKAYTRSGPPGQGISVAGGTAWSPAIVSVPTGTTVTWSLPGGIHTVDSTGLPAFPDSPPAGPTSYAYTFSTAGAFDYVCGIHDGMTGTITVT